MVVVGGDVVVVVVGGLVVVGVVVVVVVVVDVVLVGRVGMITGTGVEVVVVDVTSPDVAAAGFHVVRVLTPDLCLLDVEASARFHGRPRLLREARRAGVERLNPLPHPFP